MKLEIKLSEVKNYNQVFSKLNISDSFNVIQSYKIHKIYSKIKNELNDYIEMRKKLENKYFCKDENNEIKRDAHGNIEIKSSELTLDSYMKELTSLENTKITLELEDLALSIEDLEQFSKNGVLIPNDFSVLDKFLTDV